MRTPTLFVENAAIGLQLLDHDETHYARTVLRATVGDRVLAVDGRGSQVRGALEDAPGRRLAVRVDSVAASPRPTPLVVLLGLPRPALVDEALQLGTEAGLTELWLCRTEFSPPGQPRLDRLDRVARAACRQCRRESFPEIRVFEGLSEALSALDATPSLAMAARFYGSPGASPPALGSSAPAVVAVGPEGGFSLAEQQLLDECRFLAITLGPHILRAPTAVAVASAILGLNRSR